MTLRPLVHAAAFVALTIGSSTASAADDPRVSVDGTGVVESSASAMGADWDHVCTAPCSFESVSGRVYRVRTAVGIAALPSAHGAADYEIRSTDHRTARTAVGVGAVLAVATGLVLLVVSAVTFTSDFQFPIGCDKANFPDQRCGGPENSAGSEAIAGFVSLGIGAALGVTAAVMPSTSVGVEERRTGQSAMPGTVGKTFRAPSLVFSF